MSSLRLTGINIKATYYKEIIETKPKFAWLEIHSENYFAEGGPALYYLEMIRKEYPISLHGVGLSLGSLDELNWSHLKKLKELKSRIHPCLISDHLSWSSLNGQYFHDLLPLVYTEEALAHIVTRIKTVQDYLQTQILIENISHYVQSSHSTMTEWDFLTETAIQSGCGILLDINNIYVNSRHFNFSPLDYLSTIPKNLVQEIHLAGFSELTIDDKEILIDTHNQPIDMAVWELYRQAIMRLGTKPTIIEWDNHLPSLNILYQEAQHAEKIMRETYVATKLANGVC